MSDDVESWKSVVQLISTGGFAVAVWWELRAQRAERREDAKQQATVLAELSKHMSSVLERLRMSGPGGAGQ